MKDESLSSCRRCVTSKTYIEQCFQRRCDEAIHGELLWSNWVHSKNQYIGRTKTTIYEFMNYSLHDESHSVNILQSIEKLLGRDRVDKLKLGDLWLILHAAYAHDIGMSSDYDELVSLWKDEEFKRFIAESENSSDRTLATASRRVRSFDKFVKYCEGKEKHQQENPEQMAWNDIDAWPLEIRRDITYLMSSFLRKKHGKRSKRYFENILGSDELQEQDRLIKILGRITELHTTDINEILELDRNEDGFESEDTHPRFIAILIRIADSLDLDNNRFDIFSLKHFGDLPEISVVHFKKHKSITHLLIHPDVIEVTADSEEFEVCQIHQMWFQMIEENVKFLITHWKDMVPLQLEGCFMGMPVLKVFHNGNEFKSGFGRNFQLDKKKLLHLFTGNNLYMTKLDFIRELVQNGLDANRIALFQELRLGFKRKFYLKDPELDLSEIKPFDLTKQAYDSFPVEIIVSESKNEDGTRNSRYFCLTIRDTGIGIDEQGISAIANIGLGWRERPNFDKIISSMRQWMKPTGGFGIGIHSAFMVTDKILLKTRTEENEAYQITMQQQGGTPDDIVVEYDRTKMERGTELRLIIEFEKFNDEDILDQYGRYADPKNNDQKSNNQISKEQTNEFDYFDYNDRLEMVYNMIRAYSSEYFSNSLMPIIVRLDSGIRKRKHTIQSKFFFGRDDEGNRYMPDFYAAVETKEGARDQTVKRMLVTHPNWKHEKRVQKRYEAGIELRHLNAFYEKLASYADVPGVNEERFYFRFDENDKILRIWNDETEIFYCIKLHDGSEKSNDGRDTIWKHTSYKNVKVYNEWSEEEEEKSSHITDIIFDVMGKKVEDCLVVSRNAFLKDAKQGLLRIKPYVLSYMEMLGTMLGQQNAYGVKEWFMLLIITGRYPSDALVGRWLEDVSSSTSIRALSYKKIEDTDNPVYRWKENTFRLSDIVDRMRNSSAVIAIIDSTENNVDTGSQKTFIGIEEKWNRFCQNMIIITDERMEKIFSRYCIGRRVMAVRNIVTLEERKVTVAAIRILNGGTQTEIEWDAWLHAQEKKEAGAVKEAVKPEQEVHTEASIGEIRQGKTGSTIPDELKKRGAEIFTKSMSETDRLRPLAVIQKPYQKRQEGVIYYITPYNEAIGEKLTELIKSGMGELELQPLGYEDSGLLGLTQKQLVDVVTEDSSFGELCRWVYEHQIEPYKYTQKQIREAYISRIKDDFRRLNK